MASLDTFIDKHSEIKKKLQSIVIPENMSTTKVYWGIAASLNISGTTVKNYLSGEIKDGYLAEAIFNEFKRFKMVK